MAISLAKYINFLEPYLPEVIVPAEYLACIKMLSNNLPLVSYGFFEFNLNDSPTRTDFNISINGFLQEHRFTTEFLANNHQFKSYEQPLVKDNVVHFLEKWASPTFTLKDLIKQVWLSFDILDPVTPVVIPWYYIKFSYLPAYLSASKKALLIIKTLKIFNGSFSAELLSDLLVFFNSVSPSIFISGIGIQTSRNIASLRVYLIVQTYEELFYFLKKHKWPGDHSDLKRQINCLATGCIFYGLCIDIGPALQPKIGIEFWYPVEKAQEGLTNLTNNLIGLGLCTQVKQKAFLDWGGTGILNNEPNVWSWPHCDQNAPEVIPKEVVIHMNFKYVKVVYDPGQNLLAKGYVGFDRPV